MTTATATATDLFDAAFFQLASDCTVEAWLNFLGHRWNALILHHLSQGSKKFGEIKECLPTVAPKVMTERIVALERFGLIKRPTGSRGERYSLTNRGIELMPILNLLEVWSRELPKVPLPT